MSEFSTRWIRGGISHRLNIHRYDRVLYGYGDVSERLVLGAFGQKVLPVLEFEDGTLMPELLDIINRLDEGGSLGTKSGMYSDWIKALKPHRGFWRPRILKMPVHD